LPGKIAFTSPYLFILLAIISEPASPKPKASRVPILIMAFSIIIVSYYYSPSFTSSYSLEDNGLFAIYITLSLILSIGPRAKSLASLANKRAPTVSTMHTKIVLPIESPLFIIWT
jgi:hypothetical protein